VIIVNERGEILEKNPGSIVFGRYAEELAQEGRIDEAIEILRKGIEANPHYAPGYSVLSGLLLMKEEEDEGVEKLEAALKLDPQAPRDCFTLGRHYLEKNRPEKAAPYLWAALRFEPAVTEVEDAYEKTLKAGKAENEELRLSTESEKVLSELTETPGEEETPAGRLSGDVGAETVESAVTGEEVPSSEAALEAPPEEISAETMEKEPVPDDRAFEEEITEDIPAHTGAAEMGMEPGEPEAGETGLEEIPGETLMEEESAAGTAVPEEPVSEEIIPEEAAESGETPPTGDGGDLPEVSDEEFDELLGETGAAVEMEALETADEVTERDEETGDGESAGDETAATYESTPEGREDIQLPEVSDEEFEALLEESAPPVEESVEEGTGEVVESGAVASDEAVPGETVPEAEEEEIPGDISIQLADSEEGIELPEVSDEEFDELFEDGSAGAGEPEAATAAEETGFAEAAEEPAADGEELPSYAVELSEFSVEVEEAKEERPPEEELVGPGSGDQPEAPPVHDIDEDEGYAPDILVSAAGAGEEPVIGEEERAELELYVNGEAVTVGPETVPAAAEGGDESAEPSGEGVVSGEEGVGEFYSELTEEEIDVLSDNRFQETEADTDLERETREGIDYTDVLSEYSDAAGTGEVDEMEEERLEPDAGETSGEFGVPEPEGDLAVETEGAAEGAAAAAGETETDGTMTAEEESARDSIDLVEELIRKAPGIEIPSSGEEAEPDVSGKPLGELISEYEKSLLETGSEGEEGMGEETVSGAVPTEEGEGAGVEGEDAGEEVTATMAEIYVAQGLIERAMKIYESILEKNPNDAKARDRLEELRGIQGRNTGGA